MYLTHEKLPHQHQAPKQHEGVSTHLLILASATNWAHYGVFVVVLARHCGGSWARICVGVGLVDFSIINRGQCLYAYFGLRRSVRMIVWFHLIV